LEAYNSEQALLGIAINDRIGLADLLSRTSVQERLFSPVNEIIYKAMSEMFSEGMAVDITSLAAFLENGRMLKEMGGRTYLAELISGAPPSQSLPTHLKIVREATSKKKLNALAVNMSKMCTDGNSVNAILEKAEAEIYGVHFGNESDRPYSVGELLPDAYQSIIDISEGKGEQYAATGLKSLDRKSRWRPGDMIILAARPGMGKSAFAMNVAERTFDMTGKSVFFFSLEMTKEDLMERILCSNAKVNMDDIADKKLDDYEASMLVRAQTKIAARNISIIDQPALTIGQIRAIARRAALTDDNVGLIIIDYLQRLSAGKYFPNDNSRVAYISRMVKDMAMELKVPVLCLAQLSRTVEYAKPYIPKLSHIRDSGAVEQDADVVLFIYRKDYYWPEIEEHRGKAQIIVAKQRKGQSGFSVPCAFQKEYGIFADLETRLEPKEVLF